MTPKPPAASMVQGLQKGLADLRVTVSLHKTDVGTDLIALCDVAHPWPSPLATIWWHGIRWKALPKGKRRCLEEGWCCSAPALEGVIGEAPVPTVERAVEHLRDLIGLHRHFHPLAE